MILNYKYGLYSPTRWDASCEREIALQDTLWNELVRIELDYRAKVEATIRQNEAYRTAADKIAEVTKALDEYLHERRMQRRAARAKIATPDLDLAIAELSKERREMWTMAKPLRAAAFKEWRDDLRKLSDIRYTDIKTARQESGLWWSNYNAVVASFDSTLRRIQPWQTPRALGNEGRLSGRLSVQIQRGCPGPAFLAGARNEANIDLAEGQWQRRGSKNWLTRRATLTATVHAAGPGTRQTASWPMLMHRPLPNGAIIKALIITRRRPVPTSRRWKWEVTLTVEVPDPAAAPSALCAGVDLGWRKVEAGLRVATVADTAGGLNYLVLPAEMLDRRARIAVLQGQVEQEARARDRDKTTLLDWQRLSLEVARWNRRRRDLYRVAAAELVERCHLIGIDATGIAEMAKDKRLPPETRRMRTWAAPAEFAAAVKDAARKTGATLREITGSSTLVCHRCGHKNTASEADRQHLIWRCSGCRGIWDQDENAARNCLAAVLDKVVEDITVAAEPTRRRPPRLTRKKAPPAAEAAE